MLCHAHQCVFIHVPKTAGQSIERVFLDVLGLTWETRAPLLLRPNDDPSRGPPRLAHLTASEYVSCGHVSQTQFDSYFKFAFVRNPWDRILSEYMFRGYAAKCSLRSYLLEHLPDPYWSDRWYHVRPQCDFLEDEEGSLLVDFIGRFENLQPDFDRVCDRLRLGRRPLPHANATRYQDRRHYSSYYDSETRDLVAERYARDIARFDYEFEEP